MTQPVGESGRGPLYGSAVARNIHSRLAKVWRAGSEGGAASINGAAAQHDDDVTDGAPRRRQELHAEPLVQRPPLSP